ncbi:uncharacterized protein LOC130405542 isoform X1 [Gadus chalcogrammus]|uniref:uncharacterized protein LOC130405542 isoform X1 n=1 Tax=Gadus chalcogrammus TaxID=1042646 RepID=UPI0024C4AB3E|nr:uncharacterized protein LOC130405542 isoform X1 [Gadus chalcogrammus]
MEALGHDKTVVKPKKQTRGDNKTLSAGRDLSGKLLQDVAKSLGCRWEQAAHHLGLKKRDLDEIKKDNKDEFMQRRNMLRLWMDQRPGKATAQDLLRGLEGLEDLPVETRRLLKEASVEIDEDDKDDEGEQSQGRKSSHSGTSLTEDTASMSVVDRCEEDCSDSGLRSKPVKKPSHSSGPGSRPGELSSSLPLKMPASNGILALGDDKTVVKPKKQTRARNNETLSAGRDLSGKLLQDVAKSLGCRWEQAAHHLGLKKRDLDEIKKDNKDEFMQRRNMLRLWMDQRPGKATAQDLLRGLEGLEDLPVETRRLLKEASVEIDEDDKDDEGEQSQGRKSSHSGTSLTEDTASMSVVDRCEEDCSDSGLRSKPVKKPSHSSGPGSRPGELSSSLPLKMPASNGILALGDDKTVVKPKKQTRARNNETLSAGRDLSGKLLQDVAKSLGCRWEQAAHHLGLKKRDLDEIKKDNKDEFMQRRNMLRLWMDQRPGKATAQDLLRGLEGLEDLPVETRRLLKEASVEIDEDDKDDEGEQSQGRKSSHSGTSLTEDTASMSVVDRCEEDCSDSGLRSKPVKKPSHSSGPGSRPGELSSSLPLKMPASNGILALGDDKTVVKPKKQTRARNNETLSAGRDLSGKLLQDVAKSLGCRWEQAAHHLGLKKRDLDEIKKDNKDEFMQRRNMLRLWMDQRPGKATAQDLLRGLEGLEDLPVETRRLLKDLLPKMESSSSDASAEIAEEDEEEMHVKSQREKCKAAQQSPEYVKVTPTEISKQSSNPIIPSSLPVKHDGAVLVYKELKRQCRTDHIFRVFLSLNTIPETEAVEEQIQTGDKQWIKIDKSARCLLEEKVYHLTIEPEGQIENKNQKFTTAVLASKGFFVVRFSALERPPFKLSLMDSDCDEPLWSATIREEDWKGMKSSLPKMNQEANNRGRGEQSQGQKSSQSGTSLTEDTASMPVVDGCGEEDCSDSDASAEIDEDDEEDEGEQSQGRKSIHSGTSLTEDIASISLTDGHEEEDCSDSDASAEIDEEDEGTSLTEDIASRFLMDRSEEEDCSDSDAIAEIDEDDEDDEGTSLTEDTASMPVVDRCEEEDCSDSGASAEIDEDDEDDEDDEEEMHIKSQHEKCTAAQQSPEYVKVTPTKILKCRFKLPLKGKGTYECSATGLVFEVSEQALVRYSVLSWSEIAEFLPDSWRPAGSIWNVDVVNNDSSVLKFIHFPHSLCLSGPEHELSFSVLLVKDGQASIKSKLDFTASHVKWPVSSLSKVGPITPSSLQGKHHGRVLIYKEQKRKCRNDHIFRVFLSLNNDSEIKALEEKVLENGEEWIKVAIPPLCLLKEKVYHLKSEPKGQIEEKNPGFTTAVLASKGSFVVHFSALERPPFRLSLMDSDCDEPLWSATIREEDWKGKKSSLPKMNQVANNRGRGEQSQGQKSSQSELLRKIRSQFVQGVSNPVIKGLLDDLYTLEVVGTEEKEFVMENQKIKTDMARCLIDMVIGKGETASRIMIDSMKVKDKYLCSDLGLIPSPAAAAE